MLGGEAENQSSRSSLEQLPARHVVFSQPFRLHPPRQISCFVFGLLTLIADLLNHLPIRLPSWSVFAHTPVDDFYCFNSS
ncbi:transposase [Fischerella thermalis CCMEE 5201]|nr:transposase [Fischerella thermalis CCMEE 5201]